jgi:hypothetical protein
MGISHHSTNLVKGVSCYGKTKPESDPGEPIRDVLSPAGSLIFQKICYSKLLSGHTQFGCDSVSVSDPERLGSQHPE